MKPVLFIAYNCKKVCRKKITNEEKNTHKTKQKLKMKIEMLQRKSEKDRERSRNRKPDPDLENNFSTLLCTTTNNIIFPISA